MAIAEPGALALGKQPGAPAGLRLCFGVSEPAGQHATVEGVAGALDSRARLRRTRVAQRITRRQDGNGNARA